MISPEEILKAKILIVDDQPANIAVLEQMLARAGYTAVSSTTDPDAVCELYRTNWYDLVLLDLQMPRTDGFQVMEQLKQVERRGYLPVLVITAQPAHKLRALKAGARDFITKPFDLSEVLARVQNMVEVRLLNKELRELYYQVLTEQKMSERLLLNVLPACIAERLKGRPEVTATGFTEMIADRFEDVTVLFADIVGFTKFSASVDPKLVVNVLNEIFTRFDTIAENRGLEKIKTIGDSYMAAAGLPIPVPDHAERAANMALDLLEVMDRFNEEKPYHLNIRIGISSGAIVAGVIGKRKFLYDLWGDAVNTASRMESQGLSGRIHLSESSRLLLGEPFALESRGLIEVKGKGGMNTWFLNGRNGSSQPFSDHGIG